MSRRIVCLVLLPLFLIFGCGSDGGPAGPENQGNNEPRPPASTAWDPALAAEMMVLATSASANTPPQFSNYRWKPKRDSVQNDGFDCTELPGDFDEDTDLFLWRHKDYEDIAMAYRSTENGSGGLVDLTADQTRWQLDRHRGDGEVKENAVHRGFRCAYLSVHQQLKQYLKQNYLPEVTDSGMGFLINDDRHHFSW